MIPEENKEDIINNGINFMRSITEAYGSEEGMKLWESITSVLDPDIKGKIFFALITGDYVGTITLTSYKPSSNKVAMIKSIRSVDSRRLGLKEAKDIVDNIEFGKQQKINVDPKRRVNAILELRDAGFYV